VIDPEVLLDGLQFTESPRWHDGKLWFVDMYAGRVMTVDLAGHRDVIATIGGDDSSGIGFLPDGTPLVVSMNRRQVLRIEGGKLSLHADLSTRPAARLNDMVVDGRGRAYVDMTVSTEITDVGEDYLALVEPDGQWRIAAAGVQRPNGLVITPDGGTLIHASTRHQRLWAWTIQGDGMLTDSRIWADTGEHTPDGICMDAEGAIWLGSYRNRAFVRILPGGAITDVIDTGEKRATACMLGGSDRKTLFMCTAYRPTEAREDSQAFIEVAPVDVPGAGWP
jgi:sugar lactone lactonase YvrE